MTAQMKAIMHENHIQDLDQIHLDQILLTYQKKKKVRISEAHKVFCSAYGPINLTTFDPWLRKSMYSLGVYGAIQCSSMQKVTADIEKFLYSNLERTALLKSDEAYNLIKRKFPGRDFGTPKTLRKYLLSMKFGFKWQAGWRFSYGKSSRLGKSRRKS